MNDQVQNNVEQVQEKPVTITVTDQDGNPVEVQFIAQGEVQDKEYSDDSNGN